MLTGNIWDMVKIRNGPHVMITFVMLVVAWAVNKVIAKPSGKLRLFNTEITFGI